MLLYAFVTMSVHMIQISGEGFVPGTFPSLPLPVTFAPFSPFSFSLRLPYCQTALSLIWTMKSSVRAAGAVMSSGMGHWGRSPWSLRCTQILQT